MKYLIASVLTFTPPLAVLVMLTDWRAVLFSVGATIAIVAWTVIAYTVAEWITG